MEEPPPTDARQQVGAIMENLWQPSPGYTAPGLPDYRWQWLWDSCFHALIWCALEDDRALVELRSLFALQHADGMLPHMGYQLLPPRSRELWGVDGSSTITQPPMYGHALAVLAGSGFDVEPLLGPARDALGFLLEKRRLASGAVRIVHPWESGMDDSPRWDGFASSGIARHWGAEKVALVRSLEVSAAGSALANPGFSVEAAGFNALVAFNCLELGELTGDASLFEAAQEISAALEGCWDEEASTWADRVDGGVSSRIRTLDGLLPVLVTANGPRCEQVLGSLVAGGFASPHGLRGVHVDEPCYEPSTYWRGPSWPPLVYLFWLAASRRASPVADLLGLRALDDAVLSGFAEYCDPETGEGLGAIPQAWAGLALVIEQGALAAPPSGLHPSDHVEAE